MGIRLLAVLLLIGIGGCDGSGGGMTAPPEEEPDPVMVPQTMELSGALQDVHDPAIIAAHGQ
jgi:hypothetical protein